MNNISQSVPNAAGLSGGYVSVWEALHAAADCDVSGEKLHHLRLDADYHRTCLMGAISLIGSMFEKIECDSDSLQNNKYIRMTAEDVSNLSQALTSIPELINGLNELIDSAWKREPFSTPADIAEMKN